MAEYVSPPSPASYTLPPQYFQMLANLPSDFYRGAQQQQQYALSHAFQGGVPTNPDGTPNAAALLQIFGKNGDVQDIPQLGRMVQEQQQLAEARKAAASLPALGVPQQGSGAAASNPGAAASNPAAPAAPGGLPEGAPPASAAAAISTNAAPPSSNDDNSGGGASVDQIASQMLPAANARTVAPNVARFLKVDPNAPLNAEQQDKVRSWLRNYSQRNGLELPGSGLMARGLRNDNPGNIEDGAFARSQPGYTGPEVKGRFATFDNEQDGLNAAATLIDRYRKAGINTIAGIVNKWAPASDGNNTGNYAAAVARDLGIDPNTRLDLSNPRMRQAVATAMSQYENGARNLTGAAGQQGGRPLVPQVQLPTGFTDPQQASLALRAKAAQFSLNPDEGGIANFFDQWADRIDASVRPVMMHAGETAVDPRTGRPIYQAPGLNANNLVLQRFLAENPDATPEQIQAFEQSGKSGGRSAISMYMNRYLQENPNATADDVKRAAQLFTTQTTAQNRFLSGPQGNTIRSLNVVVSHLQTMQDLGDALKNGNIVAFNRLAQTVAEQTGSPAPTNFDTAKQIVGAEVIKALGVAGAGTQSERQEAADAFNSARSPSQLNQAIAVARRLLIGQLQGLRRQYVAATGLPGESFDQMLEPQTQTFFGQGGEDQGGNQAPARVETKAQYDALASGAKYVAPDGSVRTKQ